MANEAKQVSMDISELKEFLNYMIENNKYIQEKDKIPISINIESDAGIGKTSTAIQITEENDLQFIKINLSQIEEIGDLVGFPCKEYELIKVTESGIETRWVPESTITTYIANKYKPTGEKRMTHAAPDWIQGLKEGGILLLDDYTRADTRFMQAAMEIIDRQKYISWSLPKNWTVLLTTNPDNGDYSVSSLDPAQKTRFITVKLKFNIECWAEWAEKNEIDGRCINFMLLHPELVTKDVNPRSATTFFNSLSSIKDFEKRLPLIQQIGEGSVGQEFATLFTLFINNRLDKLVTPEYMISSKNSIDSVLKKIYECVGDPDNYRGDIASVLVNRLINYSLNYAETKTINDDFIERLEKLICKTNPHFTDDLKFVMVKKIVGGKRNKFQNLMNNPEVVQMTIK